VSALRYTAGGVTTTLSADLSAVVRAEVERRQPGLVAALEAPCERVATEARREWYGDRGVTRETGKGGAIEVITTVDADRGLIRVQVGSTDTRTSGARRAPVPAVQHSPGVAAIEYVAVTPEVYWRTPARLRGPFSLERVAPEKRARFAGMAFPVIKSQPDGAGRGHGLLLSALVRRPVEAAFAPGSEGIAAAARALGSGNG
jgi:hypothetical protein